MHQQVVYVTFVPNPYLQLNNNIDCLLGHTAQIWTEQKHK
jgi:hypothetical protein